VFDISMSCRKERAAFLRCLAAMNGNALDQYENSHASIRWMTRRRIRATGLRIKESKRHDIRDETFEGAFSTILRSVDLGSCPQITDASMIALSQGRPHLHTIDLSRCDKLSDASMIALSQGCPHLHTIDLYRCDQITDAGMIALSQGCPHLHTIDLYRCDQITDAGMIALSQGCPHLHTIDLKFCLGITDASMIALSQGCSHLHTIELLGCHVTDQGIKILYGGCAYLNTIDHWGPEVTPCFDSSVRRSRVSPVPCPEVAPIPLRPSLMSSVVSSGRSLFRSILVRVRGSTDR
jgi:hypothetical protein